MSRVLSRWSFFLCLVVVSGKVQADPGDADKKWIRENFELVYKAGAYSRVSHVDKLLINLNLLNADEKRAILKPIAEKAGKDVNELQLNATVPYPIAERFLAGLKKLKELKLVYVEIGSVSSYDRANRIAVSGLGGFMSHNRSGVMTVKEWKEIYENQHGHDYCLYMSKYTLDGRDYDALPADYIVLLEFLEFSRTYDPQTKVWEVTHPPGSREANIIQITERLIRELYRYDILYPSADGVRAFVKKNFDLFLEETDPTSDLKDGITLYNIRQIYWNHRFGDNEIRNFFKDQDPEQDDMERFEKLYRDKFKLKYGYYSERLVKKP